jgi:hypothetical protein
MGMYLDVWLEPLYGSAGRRLERLLTYPVAFQVGMVFAIPERGVRQPLLGAATRG